MRGTYNSAETAINDLNWQQVEVCSSPLLWISFAFCEEITILHQHSLTSEEAVGGYLCVRYLTTPHRDTKANRELFKVKVMTLNSEPGLIDLSVIELHHVLYHEP